MTLALAALLVSQAAASATRPIVVAMPQASGEGPALGWAPEVVAELLPRALACFEVPVLTHADVRRAHEMLALPGGHLSLASSIRLAEAAGASHLVAGRVVAGGGELRLELRLLDVDGAALGGVLEASGPVSRLPLLIVELARTVAATRTGRSPQAPCLEPGTTSVDALRALGEGLGRIDTAERLRLLTEAVRRAPDLAAARLALARQLVTTGAPEAALRQLAAVPETSSSSREARFLAGVVLLQSQHPEAARDVFGRLAAERLGAAVLNNHAVALLRCQAPLGHVSTLLRRAIEAAPGATTTAFNLALVLLAGGEGEEAAFWAQGVLRRRPHDAEAQRLWELGQGRGGASEPSARQLPAERFFPSERVLELELDQSSLVAAHLERAESLLADGRPERAAKVLTRAVYLDPFEGEVHRLLARCHRARGDDALAPAELRMALWCRDDPIVRAELAEALAGLGRAEEAHREARRVLEALPENETARRVLELR